MGICLSHQKISDGQIRLQQLQDLTYEDAEDVRYNFTQAKVLRVYDGDTITIGAWYNGGFKKFSLRIYGIDTDEMNDSDPDRKANAVRAKEYVKEQILGKIIKIRVLNGEIRDGKKIREKYGRLLATVMTPTGDDLGDKLIVAGMARRYYGGKKE